VHQRAEAVAQTHSAPKAVQGIIQPSKLLFKPYDSQSKGHIKASPVDTSALNEARIQ